MKRTPQNTLMFKIDKLKPLSLPEVENIEKIVNFNVYDFKTGKRLGKYSRDDILRKFG